MAATKTMGLLEKIKQANTAAAKDIQPEAPDPCSIPGENRIADEEEPVLRTHEEWEALSPFAPYYRKRKQNETTGGKDT